MKIWCAFKAITIIFTRLVREKFHCHRLMIKDIFYQTEPTPMPMTILEYKKKSKEMSGCIYFTDVCVWVCVCVYLCVCVWACETLPLSVPSRNVKRGGYIFFFADSEVRSRASRYQVPNSEQQLVKILNYFTKSIWNFHAFLFKIPFD